MKRIVSVISLLPLVFAAFAAGEWSIEPRNSTHVRDYDDSNAVPAWFYGETDTNHIDILIVFDESAKRWLEATGRTTSGFASFCIDDLNKSLGYTGISRHFNFRLAGMLDVSPADFSNLELSDTIAAFVPVLGGRRIAPETADTIRIARDTHNADIVAILCQGKDPIIFGYSQGLKGDDLSPSGLLAAAERSYLTCRIDEIETRHMLLHEIGHLFGAGHSDTQKKTPGPQLFKCSAAYRFHAGGTPLTTVSGYAETRDGTILPFFSSPDYELTYTDDKGTTHSGIPIGTASNDNTRTVLTTYPLISQYRVAKPTEAAALFDRELSFALAENGDSVSADGKPIVLRCGVLRSFTVTGVGDGTSIKASKLPPGFTFDAENGIITGRATKPGDTTVYFNFQSGDTPMQVLRRLAFRVEPLPVWAKGLFVSDDGKHSISISEKGQSTFSTRRGYGIAKTHQDGFVREDQDANGNPVFVFADGHSLSMETNEFGQPHGVVTSPDGERFVAAQKRQRRGRNEAKTKNYKKTKRQTNNN